MSSNLPTKLVESLPRDLQQKFDAAVSQIRLSKGAVVALSAGVDSSLVALLAHKALGDHAVPVTGNSQRNGERNRNQAPGCSDRRASESRVRVKSLRPMLLLQRYSVP